MKIPIKYAIDSGAWFQCTSGYDSDYNRYIFKTRIISFEKVNFSEVDSPDNISQDLEGGVLWIMKLQIINLNKEEVGVIGGLIRIVDEDDYDFSNVYDYHLCCWSEYAHSSGLKKLYGKYYIPKIKYTGALLYLLPDEETEYYLSVPGGNIKEI